MSDVFVERMDAWPGEAERRGSDAAQRNRAWAAHTASLLQAARNSLEERREYRRIPGPIDFLKLLRENGIGAMISQGADFFAKRMPRVVVATAGKLRFQQNKEKLGEGLDGESLTLIGAKSRVADSEIDRSIGGAHRARLRATLWTLVAKLYNATTME